MSLKLTSSVIDLDSVAQPHIEVKDIVIDNDTDISTIAPVQIVKKQETTNAPLANNTQANNNSDKA